MVAAPVLWSTAGVVTRHIERAGPFEQVFWRSLFAFVFIFFVLLFRKSNPLLAVRRAGWAGLVSGSMWAVMFTAFLFALALTSIANALVLMSISAFLTALFARLFLSEPVAARTWLATGVAAVGIAWMFGADLSGQLAGMAIAALIPLAAAINVVVLRASAANDGKERDLVPAVMLGGALSCVLAYCFTPALIATERDVALLAFLGFFQLGLPCMLLVIAARRLPAPEIALLGLLEVVLGPLWAWLAIGETPAVATLTGGAIVLAALALNEIGALKRQP